MCLAGSNMNGLGYKPNQTPRAPHHYPDPDVLEEVLSKNLEQTVDFYVYSTETDTVRTATLMPNLKWGGRGCLGAEVGHGYLHGLPQKCCKTHGA